MTTTIRFLTNNDYMAVEDFLQPQFTSMFMRSNARRVGLDYKDNLPYHARYVGLLLDNKLKGILALNWNGTIFSEVPESHELLALLHYAVQQWPEFMIKGILAPPDQAQIISDFIKPTFENIARSAAEDVYKLTLKDIVTSRNILANECQCRLACEDDINTLVSWRLAYEKEALNLMHNVNSSKVIRQNLLTQIYEQTLFVLTNQNELVSMAAFNATMPDTVQIGGVWTPEQHRRRHYARAVVAGALTTAAQRNISYTLLFTNNPYAARCYQALGFQKIGIYLMTLLHGGQILGSVVSSKRISRC